MAIQKAQIADSLEKARQDRIERDNAVVERPAGLSAVAPDVPLRAVPRFGQPTTPTKPNVPAIFEKLFEDGDNEPIMQGIR